MSTSVRAVSSTRQRSGESWDGQTERGRTVAIYRSEFLPVSQTFVRDHIIHLRRYIPTVVTHHRLKDGPRVDGVPIVVAGRRQHAWPPGFLRKRVDPPPLSVVLHEASPDIVHAHFGHGGIEVNAASRRLGLPLVVTFHGYDATVDPGRPAGRRRLGPKYARQREALVREADAIITVSQYLARRLVELGAAPSKVHVIPCGVDTTTFFATGIPDDGPILFVGRLVEKKGCADLLHATARMTTPVPVRVVGDGPLRPQLREIADRLRLDVTFLGRQTHDVVRAEIQRARVVAVPSRTAEDGDQEGLPVISLEAGASGRPVVGYRHSGIPEAVVDGVTGMLAVEGDVAGLSRALERVATDPTTCRRMGEHGRERVARLFDIHSTNGRVEDVYDHVLSTAPRSP